VSGDLRVTTPRDSLPAGGAISENPVAAPEAPVPPVPPTAPSAPEPPAAPTNPGAGGREVARMDVLRALERGELSVEAAMRRIAEIEEA
jgi:hypothetical protein